MIQMKMVHMLLLLSQQEVHTNGLHYNQQIITIRILGLLSHMLASVLMFMEVNTKKEQLFISGIRMVTSTKSGIYNIHDCIMKEFVLLFYLIAKVEIIFIS